MPIYVDAEALQQRLFDVIENVKARNAARKTDDPNNTSWMLALKDAAVVEALAGVTLALEDIINSSET